MRNFRLDDESGHQEALFSWAAYRTGLMPELQYMYHVPNGGKRDKATAAVLKRQGVKAGVPDIMLPAARAGYHGLYIELKAGENTTTKKQKEWLEYLRQDIDVFLRECRKEYRKAGLEFKYIHVMEIGKKGARHHHLVVNKIDTEILQRCWYKAYEGHNRVKVFPLDDSGNYAELASYLIKYTGTHKKGTDGALQGKRWNCSKNLVRPEPEYHIISDREYFKKEPKAIKGYYVDKNSVSMGVHSPEYYGYGYLRYTLVKITDKGG